VTSPGGGKKRNKGRPRSGSNASDLEASSSSGGGASTVESSPRLCANHFFGGCCCSSSSSSTNNNNSNNSNNKGRTGGSGMVTGCAFGWHPSARQNNATLANMLLLNAKSRADTNKQALKASLAAAIAATSAAPGRSDDDNISMDMLYHLSVVVVPTDDDAADDDDDGVANSNILEKITTALSTNSCSVGSIVYVVLGDILVFDRYRDGIMLTESDEEMLLFGDSSKRRSVSIGEYAERGGGDDYYYSGNNNNNKNNNDNKKHSSSSLTASESAIELHQRLVLHLPGFMLEYILTFLPTQATATMALVCKSWHNEIGRSSPDLWRHLLDRNEWPAPKNNDNSTTTTTTLDSTTTTIATCRDAFLSHYTAVRDVKAVVQGLQLFEKYATTGGKIVTTTKDIALLQFKEALGGRTMPGETFVRMWSERRALVANAQDCTLHLYDVVDCGNNAGQRQRCKQEVRVSVAPFGSRKKRSCTMVAMDIDNRTVGCLYEVVMGNDDDETHTWLSVAQRNDLLCSTGAGGTKGVAQQLEDGALCTHDLEAKAVDYIISCDDVEVINFLYSHGYHSDGFELSSIEIDIKENIVACGNGEYLFDASIVMPIAIDDDSVEVALPKIFLFSSDFGKITWIGPHGYSEVHYFDHTYKPRSKLVGVNHVHTGNIEDDVWNKPSAALVLKASPDTVVSIRVNGPGNVECTSNTLHRSLERRTTPWPELDVSRRARSLVTPTDIILSETWEEGADASSAKMKTEFRFRRLHGKASVDLPKELVIDGDCSIFPIQPLRNDHMIAFCENYNSACASGDQVARKLFAVLVHVPSRKVIYDSCVGEVNGSQVLAPGGFSLDAKDDAVAVSIDEVGMFVAGHGVAPNLAEASEKKTCEEKNRMEKKKKKSAKQNAKKDGFARGMRQTMG
jgi:hypothetical protein